MNERTLSTNNSTWSCLEYRKLRALGPWVRCLVAGIIHSWHGWRRSNFTDLFIPNPCFLEPLARSIPQAYRTYTIFFFLIKKKETNLCSYFTCNFLIYLQFLLTFLSLCFGLFCCTSYLQTTMLCEIKQMTLNWISTNHKQTH